MARPRGRSKPARLTVNLDESTYDSIVRVARREDVSVSWVIRRAIKSLLAHDLKSTVGPALGESSKGKDSVASRKRPPQ